MRRRYLIRRGIGLIEVLIGVAISAILLTAVGAAFASTLRTIEQNDQFFRASQAARVSMNQMLNGIRWCQSGTVDDHKLELTIITGATRIYQFDQQNKTLMMSLSDQTLQPVPLAHNVSHMKFSTDGKSIAVSMTVKIDSSTVTLHGSAVPRRNVVYAD